MDIIELQRMAMQNLQEHEKHEAQMPNEVKKLKKEVSAIWLILEAIKSVLSEEQQSKLSSQLKGKAQQ